ncbi:MAG: YbaK/EbsC family protein [Anaerolineales bacterium]|nr:YbaK/EbsC family protein [Anaerolineales bacterium]
MMNDALTPNDLDIFMQEQGMSGQILFLNSPTPTVEAAAQAVGTSTEQIVKSILFLVNERLILAVTCGEALVDRKAIASLFGVGKKKVKLASPEVVLRETGFSVGSMPPFGHRSKLLTLLDQRVLEQPEVFAGGGAENALVKLDPRAILETTNAQVIDLIRSPEPNR